MINLRVKTETFSERENLVLLLPDASWQFKEPTELSKFWECTKKTSFYLLITNEKAHLLKKHGSFLVNMDLLLQVHFFWDFSWYVEIVNNF